MASKFNYARTQATAKRLITKFGQVGAVQRFSDDYAETSVNMVVLEYATREVDGTRVTAKDRRIYVESLPFEISKNDRIKDAAGTVYEIIPPVKPLSPAGTIVFTEIQGRS